MAAVHSDNGRAVHDVHNIHGCSLAIPSWKCVSSIDDGEAFQIMSMIDRPAFVDDCWARRALGR